MRIKTVNKANKSNLKRNRHPQQRIIGVDEVGRGSLSGPVTVAAVFLPRKFNFHDLKDSKKLTPLKREAWFNRIRSEKEISYSISSVSHKIIDAINIKNATDLAATIALQKLLFKKRLKNKKVAVFLDGGLKVDVSSKIYTKTVIRGDEKIDAIKLASIVAKVNRDRFMVKMHKKYPKYGFDKNKGYGTRMHIKAIKSKGVTKIHRLTFLKNYIRLN